MPKRKLPAATGRNPKKNRETVASIDYMTDFEFPENEMSFHWWDNTPVMLHNHNHHEILLTTEGRTMHTVNGVRSELSRGNMVFIRADDRHKLEPIDGIKVQHINLSVTKSKFDEIISIVPGFKKLFADKRSNLSVTLFDNELQYFLNNAHQINLLKNKNIELYKYSTAVITSEMIVSALSIMYKRNLNIATEYPAWFNELLQKLHSPEALGYQVSDIYAISNYSRTRLLKYFKDYLGETIVSYFAKIKMQFACNLLRSTNFTVLDIANRISYDSISHFNKVFKEYTGKTPSAYRKSKNIFPTDNSE
jgi:AraC-like DNA-binding protein/mannose-6-phosphate isomerase-like protein (cupin superfamily)